MKKLVIALFVCICCLSLIPKAQLRVALTGGAHLSSVPSNASPGWDSVAYDYESRLGYHFGVLADMQLGARSPIFLQSGMHYFNKGRSFSKEFDTTSSAIVRINGKQYVNYIEVPLNLVLKIKLGKKAKFIIGGGGYVSFLYSGMEQKETHYINGTVTTMENKDLKVPHAQGKYQDMDYGVNGLAGFEVGRFFLTANYSMGLKDFYQPSTGEGEFRHQVMGGTLGFYLTNPAKRAAKKAAKAAEEEKKKDKDKDGIPDKEDACPTEKGTTATKGCPDKDGDGTPDKDDKCADAKGSAKHNGCPAPDSDNDGVNDDADKCPDVAGYPKYNGCLPPDSDNDGVNDEDDKCPGVVGNPKYGGCAIPDTDKDGVNDEEDRCPTVKGKIANRGCPEIKKEIVSKVNNAARRVQFEYKSTRLTKQSKVVLDEVVKLLKSNPELNVFIEGYTSSDGNPANHMKLSTARAESVRKYFVSKGIEPARLTAEGFGAANLLNSERTEFLRARNRRVEMKLTNN